MLNFHPFNWYFLTNFNFVLNVFKIIIRYCHFQSEFGIYYWHFVAVNLEGLWFSNIWKVCKFWKWKRLLFWYLRFLRMLVLLHRFRNRVRFLPTRTQTNVQMLAFCVPGSMATVAIQMATLLVRMPALIFALDPS